MRSKSAGRGAATCWAAASPARTTREYVKNSRRSMAVLYPVWATLTWRRGDHAFLAPYVPAGRRRGHAARVPNIGGQAAQHSLSAFARHRTLSAAVWIRYTDAAHPAARGGGCAVP